MAEHQADSGPLEARTTALNILRVMYLTFQESKEAEKDEKIAAQVEADLATRRLSYSATKERFVAMPDNFTEEVDALQLLELIDLAERYDTPIEIEGFLVLSYIPATFVVCSDGKVVVTVECSSDYNRAWSILETEYSMISVIELV